MKFTIFTCLSLVACIIVSCNRHGQQRMVQVTERIQYDVDIKSPDPDFDWWVQNIEGSKREVFIKQVMDAAYNGQVKAYSYFGESLTPRQVREIGFRRDTLTFQRAEPPYAFYDTVVERRINFNDITRFRFLEEWRMDPNTLEIHKKVTGIAPILKRYEETGELRGYMPLFWVYFDEEHRLK